MVTDKEIKQFYGSVAWQRTRGLKLSLNPLCEACEMSGAITSASEVHHMRPVRLFWDDRFNIKFLVSLCTSHHTAIEDEIRQQFKVKAKCEVGGDNFLR